MKLVSFIIPVFNEKENISQLYTRIKSTSERLFPEYDKEIIFVDDGSNDETFSLIQNIHELDKTVKGIQFSRNFGHHIAIAAGIECARGDLAITMDGDLQDRPEDIEVLYNKMKEGYDAVCAIKENRKDPIFARAMSEFFWWFINKMAGAKIPSNQSMLRIFNKQVLEALQSLRESNRFFGGLFYWVGFRQATCLIPYTERCHGRSKYSVSKMFSLAINAILGYSNKPLFFIFYTGLLFSSISFLYGIFIIGKQIFYDIHIEGWTSIMVLLSFMGGIIIFSIGVLGIYLGRLYIQTLNRPIYIVKNKLI